MGTLPVEIRSLSTLEKIDLLEALWADLEGQPSVLSEEQRDELDERLRRYALDPSNVVPWEQVKAGFGQR